MEFISTLSFAGSLTQRVKLLCNRPSIRVFSLKIRPIPGTHLSQLSSGRLHLEYSALFSRELRRSVTFTMGTLISQSLIGISSGKPTTAAITVVEEHNTHKISPQYLVNGFPITTSVAKTWTGVFIFYSPFISRRGYLHELNFFHQNKTLCESFFLELLVL